MECQKEEEVPDTIRSPCPAGCEEDEWRRFRDAIIAECQAQDLQSSKLRANRFPIA